MQSIPVKLAVVALVALLSTGCTLGQSRVFAIAGQAADVVSTQQALRVPGAQEVNPLFSWAPQKQVWITASLFKVAVFTILELTLGQSDQEALRSAYRMFGGTGFAAASWNTYQITRSRPLVIP